MGWKQYGSICNTGASQDECCCGNYCALASGQSAGGTGVCQEEDKRGGGRTAYAQRQIYRGGVGGGARPPYGGLPQGKKAGGSCKRKGMTVTSSNGVKAVVDCHGTWSGSRRKGWKCVPCDNLGGSRIGGGVPTPSPTYPTPPRGAIGRGGFGRGLSQSNLKVRYGGGFGG